MNPVSARLLGQQLVCPQFSTPHDVVSWMGAMQAQDYKAMRWAVEMRTKRPSVKAFEKAFNEGSIIRTHLLRSTWQLVASDDYRWMIDLCSGKARSSIRGWMKQQGLSISEAEERRFQDFLCRTLKGRGSLNREAMEAIVKESTFAAELPRLKYQMVLAEVSGIVCSGDLTERDRTYILTEDKIPPQVSLTREEALAELAHRYFRSHSPATLEDFVWWSGLNTGECKMGVEAIRDRLIEEPWKGLNFFLHKDTRTRGFRSGCIHLLPAYDEYLIGYKSRHVALHPDWKHRAHDNRGIFWPVILLDGEVVGNWSAVGGEVRTEMFRQDALLAPAALRYQKAPGNLEAMGDQKELGNQKALGNLEALGIQEALGNQKALGIQEALGNQEALEKEIARFRKSFCAAPKETGGVQAEVCLPLQQEGRDANIRVAEAIFIVSH